MAISGVGAVPHATAARALSTDMPSSRTTRSVRRIRYYGLLASGQRAENIARARELLMPPIIPVDAIKAISPNAVDSPNAAEPQTTNLCPCCGGRMIIIERFERGATPYASGRDQDRYLMIPLLGHRPPQPSSPSCAQFAESCTRKHPAQPTAYSYAPTRSH
jgi:hypothetical protein